MSRYFASISILLLNVVELQGTREVSEINALLVLILPFLSNDISLLCTVKAESGTALGASHMSLW